MKYFMLLALLSTALVLGCGPEGPAVVQPDPTQPVEDADRDAGPSMEEFEKQAG